MRWISPAAAVEFFEPPTVSPPEPFASWTFTAPTVSLRSPRMLSLMDPTDATMCTAPTVRLRFVEIVCSMPFWMVICIAPAVEERVPADVLDVVRVGVGRVGGGDGDRLIACYLLRQDRADVEALTAADGEGLVGPDGARHVHLDGVRIVNGDLLDLVVPDRDVEVLLRADAEALGAARVAHLELVHARSAGRRHALDGARCLGSGKGVGRRLLGVVEAADGERAVRGPAVERDRELPPDAREDHRSAHQRLRYAEPAARRVVLLSEAIPEEAHLDAPVLVD